MHAKATINGNTIAETDHFEYVEGNVYFPPESIIKSDEMGLTPSSHTTHCPWKGQSTYYDVHMNGATIQNAAWGYESPLPKAVNIKDHVAFGEWSMV